MTESQLSNYRDLRAARRAAVDAYHAALTSKAPATVRHAAERRCSETMAALTAWQAKN